MNIAWTHIFDIQLQYKFREYGIGTYEESKSEGLGQLRFHLAHILYIFSTTL